MAAFKRGDPIEWNTSQGRTCGTVVGTVATAKASQADPEVEVRSAKSGATAVHHPDVLKKVR
jgi:hypothetical protein